MKDRMCACFLPEAWENQEVLGKPKLSTHILHGPRMVWKHLQTLLTGVQKAEEGQSGTRWAKNAGVHGEWLENISVLDRNPRRVIRC